MDAITEGQWGEGKYRHGMSLSTADHSSCVSIEQSRLKTRQACSSHCDLYFGDTYKKVSSRSLITDQFTCIHELHIFKLYKPMHKLKINPNLAKSKFWEQIPLLRAPDKRLCNFHVSFKSGIYMYVSNFKFFSSQQNILQEFLNKRDSLNKSKFFPNMYNLVAMDI